MPLLEVDKMMKKVLFLLLVCGLLSYAFEDIERKHDVRDEDENIVNKRSKQNSYYCLVPCKYCICLFKPSKGKKDFTIDNTCAQQVNAPLVCTNAFEGLARMETYLESRENVTEDDIALFNVSINLVCTDCFVVFQEYYACLGESYMFDLLRQVICVKNEADYCPTSYLEFNRMDLQNNDCNITNNQSCTDECHAHLNETKEALGCCATSLFHTMGSFYRQYLTDEKFDMCGVTLGDACEAVPVPGSSNSVKFNVILIMIILSLLVMILLEF